MTLSIVIVLVFLSLTAVGLAIALTLRDLMVGPQTSAATGPAAPASIPVLRSRRRESPPQGLLERFDHALNDVVSESGLGIDTMRACLVVIAGSLILGGSLFVFSDNLLLGMIGILLGCIGGWTILRIRCRRRLAKYVEQLPDAIELLARAVRAGESLEQALRLAGEKSAEPLATEFRRVGRHLELGLALPAAVQALASRVDLLEIKILTTTLAVHRQTGGDLTRTLDRMATVLRERSTYRRQLKATTAAGRFSAIMVATIGPILFAYMFLFQPAYSQKLLTLPLGQVLLALAVGLELLGLAWIARMLRPEY